MKRLISTVCLCFALLAAGAEPVAFPGAYGFGRDAVGGRHGSVYHVTNLNDSGAGSLRDAVSQSNRIIVFDVSGVIKLQSRLVFSSNLYVAGQTAPGEGITLYGNGVSFSGASNTIVRYLRIRMGSGGDSGKDAAGVANGTHMIFDHLSVSWGLDETFSINSDGKGDLGDITIQNTIMSQGLMTHSAGGLMQADHITLYRNLYVDNSTRNNKVKGTNQYVNNVVYNWKNGCYLMGGDSQGLSYCNATGNLFINGPAVGGNAFTGGNANFHIYADDNWQDRNRDGLFDPALIQRSEYSGPPTFMEEPYDYPALPQWKGNTLIDSLIPMVGANLPYRDPVDFYVIDEVLSLGKKGNLISKESDLPIGIPTDWPHRLFDRPTDSDGDGMPDAWETANGTDPLKDDAMVIAADGYANIEHYINSISLDDRTFFLRVPFTLALEESTQNTLTLSWRDCTEGEEGFIVERKGDNGFEEAGRTAATSFTLTGLEPATAYTFRLRAYKGESYSDYTAELTVKTQPKSVPMVELTSYTPDFTWAGGSGVWSTAADRWTEGLYIDGSKVLIENDSPAVIDIEQPVAPQTVVLNPTAKLTFKGAAIGGEETSVNLFGNDTLDMGAAAHAYTGATVLHGGCIRLAKLANGGVESSLGASQEFAQNWIWDGGTWQYTGGNVSTNRSAVVYRNTVFDITSGSTVTMNGALEGSGAVTFRGGQVTVGTTSFFAYSGDTRLEDGATLYLSTTDISKQGLGTSPRLVLAGGTLKTKGESSNYETYTFPITVEEGHTSTLAPSRNCYLKNTVSGNGTLHYTIPYVREYIQGDWNGFYGKLEAEGTGSDKDGSQLLLNNSGGLPNMVVELQGNTQIVSWSNGKTYSIGGLSGPATTALCGADKKNNGATVTWKVGGANTDETFNGIIDNRCSSSGYSGTTSIVKEGDGDWRLTGTNIYKGTTQVNGGRLIVNGKHSATGAYTVNDGGTLTGKGTVAGKVSVKAGGILSVGDTLFNKKDVFTLQGGFDIASGGIVAIPLHRQEVLNNSPKIAVGAASTFNGILRLDMTLVTLDIPVNSSFALFNIGSGVSFKGNVEAVEPAQPGPGLKWDLSELFTSGKIFIRDEGYVALEQTYADPVSTEWFNLAGGRIASADAVAPGQLYLVRKTWPDGHVTVEKIIK